MENLFIKIIDLLKFEWYTKNLTLVFFSITILSLYDLMISPIFNRISFIYSIVDNISNSGILLNTWNLLLLTPYFIAESTFTLGVLYYLLSFINKYIDLNNVLFNYFGKAIKILLLFYPLSVILLCIAIHQPNISKEVFGGFIFASGAVISIILGVIGLLFSLFSSLNIPYRKKDIFSDY
ncbi:hypothetical protein [Staphylococcus pettenkoferi]|uniref:hypothetical protein n=1 Tax=Staphylococcus pettenkoferi TaxID=170573 RepID=UPI0022758DA6|nr:hypothetical protein [Staphylococcus pettenkoferi]MCY1627762.1 hypothetical protein [Staphylococcus pettenkoferi]